MSPCFNPCQADAHVRYSPRPGSHPPAPPTKLPALFLAVGGPSLLSLQSGCLSVCLSVSDTHTGTQTPSPQAGKWACVTVQAQSQVSPSTLPLTVTLAADKAQKGHLSLCPWVPGLAVLLTPPHLGQVVKGVPSAAGCSVPRSVPWAPTPSLPFPLPGHLGPPRPPPSASLSPAPAGAHGPQSGRPRVSRGSIQTSPG